MRRVQGDGGGLRGVQEGEESLGPRQFLPVQGREGGGESGDGGREVKTFFSQKEFAAFVAGTAGQVKLIWLALSGDLLNETDSAELQHLLDEFFRKRGHRSFRKGGGR